MTPMAHDPYAVLDYVLHKYATAGIAGDALLGAGIGGLAGATAGGIYGAAAHNDPQKSRLMSALRGAGVGGAAGAGLGAAGGAAYGAGKQTGETRGLDRARTEIFNDFAQANKDNKPIRRMHPTTNELVTVYPQQRYDAVQKELVDSQNSLAVADNNLEAAGQGLADLFRGTPAEISRRIGHMQDGYNNSDAYRDSESTPKRERYSQLLQWLTDSYSDKYAKP